MRHRLIQIVFTVVILAVIALIVIEVFQIDVQQAWLSALDPEPAVMLDQIRSPSVSNNTRFRWFEALAEANEDASVRDFLLEVAEAVSYTHLTLPTN